MLQAMVSAADSTAVELFDAVAGLSLSWLKEIFSLSNVAGYSATGRVTQDRRRKTFLRRQRNKKRADANFVEGLTVEWHALVGGGIWL